MMPANQATPNARLRRQRLRRGWSLQRVADELQKICEQEGRRVGVTASMVGKWERGFKRPSPFYQENLCSLYGMTAEQLGLVDDTAQTAPAWFDNGTLAETLESWRHDVEPRAVARASCPGAGPPQPGRPGDHATRGDRHRPVPPPGRPDRLARPAWPGHQPPALHHPAAAG